MAEEAQEQNVENQQEETPKEEPKLYAGKYESVEALEQAVVEQQKVIGKKQLEDIASPFEAAGIGFDNAVQRVANGGALTDAEFAALKDNGISKGVAERLLSTEADNVNLKAAKAQAERERAGIDVFGSVENANTAIEWARDNLPQNTKDVLNTMPSNEAAEMLRTIMQSQGVEFTGEGSVDEGGNVATPEPKFITGGKPATTPAGGFRSADELRAAQNEARQKYGSNWWANPELNERMEKTSPEIRAQANAFGTSRSF